jgi:membrane protein
MSFLSNVKDIARCVYRAGYDTVMHDGIEHAGYLAFLGLLALFPFLVFVVALLAAIDPNTELAANFIRAFSKLPAEVARALEPRILEITSGPPQGLLTLAIVGTLWTASSAIEGLRTILNRAYQVRTPPHYLFRRSLSVLQLIIFACTVIIGTLLLLTLPVVLAGMDALVGWLGFDLHPEARFWSRAAYGISLFLLVTLVAWTYYAIPNIRQRWLSVWPGAFITVLGWMLAARLFVLFLNYSHQLTLVYGSLGGVIGALIFFYICNIIFIFGAEFNHHISAWAGMKVVEREDPEHPNEA